QTAQCEARAQQYDTNQGRADEGGCLGHGLPPEVTLRQVDSGRSTFGALKKVISSAESSRSRLCEHPHRAAGQAVSSAPGRQDYAKARLAALHVLIRFRGTFERKDLVHRAHSTCGGKGEGVLRVHRGPRIPALYRPTSAN